MCAVPFIQTNKTKLISTSTSNMIASLRFTYKHSTIRASSPLFMTHLIHFITVSLVFLHHTLLTKISSTHTAL